MKRFIFLNDQYFQVICQLFTYSSLCALTSVLSEAYFILEDSHVKAGLDALAVGRLVIPLIL